MANQSVNDEHAQAEQERRSITGLVSELSREFSHLFRQEIALARAETSENLAEAKSGATMVVVGGVIAATALIVLLMAAVYGLSDIMHPGWAALIVGAAAVVIGGLMAKSGSSQLKARSLMPSRTQQTLKRDAEMLKHEAHTAKRREQ